MEERQTMQLRKRKWIHDKGPQNTTQNNKY